jgi:predicted adenine nucleotide alpha hydrolase (AANH) superfamily ATPase
LGVWEDLKSSCFDVTNYFYNHNIWPTEEYDKRKDNLLKVVAELGTKIIEEKYEPQEYQKAVRGVEESPPERCLRCYELRLQKTAECAKRGGFKYFSTTLLVSPYQNREALLSIGREVGTSVGVKFYEADWRVNFRDGQTAARDLDIYRQKYCGCSYSRKDR